jgi:hypothetical protein
VKARVYVEGRADSAALEALLKPLIYEARQKRNGIQFFPLRGKDSLLELAGRKGANDLLEHPDDWVFALPDLYPMAPYHGSPREHGSCAELRKLLERRFTEHANRVGVAQQCRNHFRVFCLKHDLEVLLLAAPESLRERLLTPDALKRRWRNPPEDQNDDKPPKRIVETLFRQYAKRGYIDTTDAPWILGRATLADVVRACPQQFAPFVEELRRVAAS